MALFRPQVSLLGWSTVRVELCYSDDQSTLIVLLLATFLLCYFNELGSISVQRLLIPGCCRGKRSRRASLKMFTFTELDGLSGLGLNLRRHLTEIEVEN